MAFALKTMMRRHADEGNSVFFSTHILDVAEKLCDRVALIDRGQKVLDGSVADVKARHGKNTVVLAYDGDGAFVESLPGVARVTDFGQYVEVRLQDGADPQPVLREAVARLRAVVPPGGRGSCASSCSRWPCGWAARLSTAIRRPCTVVSISAPIRCPWRSAAAFLTT